MRKDDKGKQKPNSTSVVQSKQHKPTPIRQKIISPERLTTDLQESVLERFNDRCEVPLKVFASEETRKVRIRGRNDEDQGRDWEYI